MPDGTYVDLIHGWDGPNPRWQSTSGPSGQYDPTRSVIGPDGQVVKLNDFLGQQGLPQAPAYTSPKPGMTPLSSVGGGAGYGMLSGGTGDLTQIAAKALETSPGFQFRLAEGQKALERSAAARGTLLTGGTLKGINRFAQDYASNEYGNQYARLFGEQNARYNQLYGLSNIGLTAAGQSAGLRTSYANNAGNLYQNQANTGTGLITGGANAQAAGTIGQGNATSQQIAGGTNAIQQALLMWYVGGQQGPPPTGGGTVPGTTGPYPLPPY